jgi:hypothetical protein
VEKTWTGKSVMALKVASRGSSHGERHRSFGLTSSKSFLTPRAAVTKLSVKGCRL